MSINRRYVGVAAGSILVGGLIFASGHILGQRQVSQEPPSPNPTGVAKIEKSRPPAPAARSALQNAVSLRDQNKFAYQAAYLNKRYRVVGIVEKIEGPFTSDKVDPFLRFIDGFTVVLEPWEEVDRNNKPRVRLNPPPQAIQLSMRPLQDIDATCVLTDWMDFQECELNRPINPKIPPGRKPWFCKEDWAIRSDPTCR